jgi:excisionase family DNA binding protein
MDRDELIKQAEELERRARELRARARKEVMPTEVRRIVGYQGLVAYLGGAITAGTLRRKVTEGNIPFIRTGPRSVCFDLNQIDAWLEDGQGVPSANGKVVR